jgi:hypothetical protein
MKKAEVKTPTLSACNGKDTKIYDITFIYLLFLSIVFYLLILTL